MFVSVAFPLPVDRCFTYSVPERLRNRISVGKRLLCPFGSRHLVGFCVSVTEESDITETKEVTGIIDEEPLISPALLRLAEFISEKYLSPLGQVLDSMVPAPVKRRKKRLRKMVLPAAPRHTLLSEAEKRTEKQKAVLTHIVKHPEGVLFSDLKKLSLSPSAAQRLAKDGLLRLEKMPYDSYEAVDMRWAEPKVKRLTDEQQKAVDALKKRLAEGGGVVLLEGVAGSGKTEVYIRAAEETVRQGKKVIVLVPEIALTPQTAGRFSRRFERLALLHSRQTDAERAHYWRRIVAGEVDVVVGARSAIFAPLSNLGLIVIDEEQEVSFKQENAPRYHARDVALMRARLDGAVVILGSATPDARSFQKALDGDFLHLTLRKRVRGGRPPRIVVVDLLRERLARGRRHTAFSDILAEELIKTVERGEQAILFINRRGYATLAICADCRHIMRCPSCDIALTYHYDRKRLLCHYCGAETNLPRFCPLCMRPTMRLFGFGTERVTEEVSQLLNGRRVVRVDSDSMRTEKVYIDTLQSFKDGGIDVLVGTQMVAKGLDFPNVTLVGIIYADWMLNFPDYRACERTFQLLLQASGRAGRALKPGTVIVQTLMPNHFVIEAARRGDYESFIHKELAERRRYGYPPFAEMVRIVVEARLERAAYRKATSISQKIDGIIRNQNIKVLGPAPCPLKRLRNRYRYHILLKSTDAKALHELLQSLRPSLLRSGLSVDVDPYTML